MTQRGADWADRILQRIKATPPIDWDVVDSLLSLWEWNW